MNNELQIKDVISKAWDLTREKNGIKLALILLVVSLVPGLVYVFAAFIFPLLGLLLSGIAAVVVSLGVFAIFLAQTRNPDSEVDFKVFSRPADVYVKYFLAFLVVSIATSIGYCLCIVPGLYLSVRLAFVYPVLIENPDLTIKEAIKKSWGLTDKKFVSLLILFFVCGLIATLGSLCCLVGVFYASVVVLFAYTLVYLQLTGEIETPAIENNEAPAAE